MDILDPQSRLRVDANIDRILDDLRTRRCDLFADYDATSERARIVNIIDLYGRMLTIIKQHLLEIA